MALNRTSAVKVIAFTLAPWTIMENENNDRELRLKGLSASILFMILKSMSIRYDLLHQKDNISGLRLPNGSWIGLLKSLDTDVADISVNALAISYTRAQVADFTNPFACTNMVILGSSPPPTPTNIAGLVTVFHKEVWLGIMISMAILLFVSCLRIIKDRNGSRLATVEKAEFYSLLFSYVAALFFEGTPRSPATGRQRCLYGMWWLLMILLGNAFCGLFRASMMAKREGEKIQSLDRLAEVSDRIKPIILAVSAYEQYFKGGESAAHKTILRAVYKYQGAKKAPVLFSPEVLSRLVRSEAVIIHEKYMVMYQVYDRCHTLKEGNFYLAKEEIYPHHFAFAIKKNLDPKLRAELNKRVRWTFESGIPKRLMDDETRKYDRCTKQLTEEEGWSALSFRDVNMIMVFILVCSAVSALVLILEYCVYILQK